MSRTAPVRIFLLSPARLDGQRARLLFQPVTMFPVAQQLRLAEGAPIGQCSALSLASISGGSWPMPKRSPAHRDRSILVSSSSQRTEGLDPQLVGLKPRRTATCARRTSELTFRVRPWLRDPHDVLGTPQIEGPADAEALCCGALTDGGSTLMPAGTCYLQDLFTSDSCQRR